jgi:diguanylate cyclase (GGDEF)-like protein
MGIADRLAENVRRCDMLGRLTDEIFAVSMPAVTLQGAAAIAEGLCHAVASEPFDTPAGQIPATVTVGVVALAMDDTIVSVIKRAEAAMQAAKRPEIPQHAISPPP